jgi:hypothetical protein
MDKQKEFDLKVTPEQALAKFLDCDVEDAADLIEGGDYLVLTDEEADEKAKEAIIESLWAFNASFILGECGLDLSGEDALQKMQGEMCEGAQDFITSLIEKTCGLDSFVESAISADGRGHFLASYDSEENEEGNYFIYRIN